MPMCLPGAAGTGGYCQPATLVHLAPRASSLSTADRFLIILLRRMILCIGTTPAAQRVMVFPRLQLDDVNRASATLDGVAGKSINVAKVLHALGAPCIAASFLGGERGESLRGHLEARGIELEFVPVSAPTRQCITVIDQAAGTVTELVEESQPVAASDYDKLMELVQRRVARCQAVVISGTIASGGPTGLYLRCAQLANSAGALVIIDAKGRALEESLAARPALVKPNRSELEATLGCELRTEASLMQAMNELHAKGAQRVVITAGSEPALAFDGQSFWRAIPPAVAARNPIGSGDAFTAALSWRLVCGDSLPEALRWAAAAGAANALTDMAGEVELKDIERLRPQVQIESI